jgi:hypothetical protein
MTTQHPSRRTPVKGHPGIYQRGHRFGVRYRADGKTHERTFATLDEAREFKDERAKARERGRGWLFTTRFTAEPMSLGFVDVIAWSESGICEAKMTMTAEVAAKLATDLEAAQVASMAAWREEDQR